MYEKCEKLYLTDLMKYVIEMIKGSRAAKLIVDGYCKTILKDEPECLVWLSLEIYKLWKIHKGIMD